MDGHGAVNQVPVVSASSASASAGIVDLTDRIDGRLLSPLLEQGGTSGDLYSVDAVLRGNFSTSAESGLDGTAATTASVARLQHISWEELITYKDKEPPDKDVLCFTHGSHDTVCRPLAESYFSVHLPETSSLSFKSAFFDLKEMSHKRIYLMQLEENCVKINMHLPSFLVKFPLTRSFSFVYKRRLKGYMPLTIWLKRQNNVRKIALGWQAFLHISRWLPSYPSCTVFIRDSDEDTLNIKVDTCQILDGSLRPESAKQFLEKGFVCKDIYSKELSFLLNTILCSGTNNQDDGMLKLKLNACIESMPEFDISRSGYDLLVIEDPASLDAELSQIDFHRCERIISLDCEGKTKSSVSLLQLAFPGTKKCLLVRPSKISDDLSTTSLAKLLADRSIIKVGVGIDHDGVLLREMGLPLKGFVDLQHLASKYKLNGTSLKQLASQLLHLVLDKSTRNRSGNWNLDELTNKQVTYACKDVIVAFPLLEELTKTPMENLLEGECESYRRLVKLRDKRYKPRKESVQQQCHSYQIFPALALILQCEILESLQFQLETPLQGYTKKVKKKLQNLSRTMTGGKKENTLRLIRCCAQHFLDEVCDARLAYLSLPPMTSENVGHWSVSTCLMGHRVLCFLLCLHHLWEVEIDEAFFRRMKDYFPTDNLLRAFCNKFRSFARPIIQTLLQEEGWSFSSQPATVECPGPPGDVVEDQDVPLSSADEEQPLAVSSSSSANSSTAGRGENALFVTPQQCYATTVSPAKVVESLIESSLTEYKRLNTE